MRRLAIFLPTLLLLLAGCGRESVVPLRIVHWNDYHARNVPAVTVTDEGDTVQVGGAATLAGYINHYRSDDVPTLALHAGDDFQGSPISSVTRGRSQVELLNAIHPDAFTIGNHEFDYGTDSLLAAMERAEFPVLLGNVVRDEDSALLFPADTLLQAGPVNVAVIGVLTENLREETTQKATRGLHTLSAREVVDRGLLRLTPRSDVQIVLSHMGWHADSVLATQFGNRIDLIVGGHSHTLIEHPRWVNEVPIVQAGERGRYLGVVEMDVDTSNDVVRSLQGRIEAVQVGVYPPDEDVAAIVERQEAGLAARLDEVVADLQRDWIRGSRAVESNVGQWMADAIRTQAGTDMAVINTGGLRTDITAGPLTIREIMEVAPFGNEIMTFQLTGAELRDYVSHEAERDDRFMVPSGFTWSATRAGEVRELKVHGEAVQDERIYTMATLNYVTDHFETFFGLARDEVERLETTYVIDRDALVDEARDQAVIPGEMQPRAVILDR